MRITWTGLNLIRTLPTVKVTHETSSGSDYVATGEQDGYSKADKFGAWMAVKRVGFQNGRCRRMTHHT